MSASIASRMKRASRTAARPIRQTRVPRCGRIVRSPSSDEADERFAHRLAADAELRRDLGFRDLLIGLEVVANDPLAQRTAQLRPDRCRQVHPRNRALLLLQA